ncbi:MAG: hypothetical protein EBR30_10760 [Cytophagia bacterium]|nr:hypothetical protein [Cytophagia bacterium]
MSNEFKVNVGGLIYTLKREDKVILCKCEGRWNYWGDIEFLGNQWLTDKLKKAMENKEEIEEQFIQGIMGNFPEAAGYLLCIRWKYDEMLFTFREYHDDGKVEHHELNREKLLAAIPVAKEKWPRGCTQFYADMWTAEDSMDDWLCQADATDFDAFVQIAIFGELVYG